MRLPSAPPSTSESATTITGSLARWATRTSTTATMAASTASSGVNPVRMLNAPPGLRLSRNSTVVPMIERGPSARDATTQAFVTWSSRTTPPTSPMIRRGRRDGQVGLRRHDLPPRQGADHGARLAGRELPRRRQRRRGLLRGRRGLGGRRRLGRPRRRCLLRRGRLLLRRRGLGELRGLPRLALGRRLACGPLRRRRLLRCRGLALLRGRPLRGRLLGGLRALLRHLLSRLPGRLLRRRLLHHSLLRPLPGCP